MNNKPCSLAFYSHDSKKLCLGLSLRRGVGFAFVVGISLVTSCSWERSPSSFVQIAGGQKIDPSAFPAVVEVKSDTLSALQQTCTGVFIRPQVMLTAAHCVWHQKSADPSTPRSTANRERFDEFDPGVDDLMDARRNRTNPFRDDLKDAADNPGVRGVEWAAPGQAVQRSTCFVIPKGYGLEAGRPGSRFDLALVFWPDPHTAPGTMEVAGKTDQGFSSGQEVLPQEVILLGYGWDQLPFADSHILRQGTALLANPEKPVAGILQTYFLKGDSPEAPQKQMIRDGDSGGPMLAGGKVVGIASALLSQTNRRICKPLKEDGPQDSRDCSIKTLDVGFHVDLTYPVTADFILKNIEKFSTHQIDPKSGQGCTPRNKKDFLNWLQANPDIL